MIDSVNQKELNYCLRHHTNATLRFFGLKDLTPRFNDIYDNYHWGWAGLFPISSGIPSKIYSEDVDVFGFKKVLSTNLPVFNILFIKDFGDE
ncbi:hypothetical protein Phab24_id159 [Acinetobacter phage Phab24]|nr:hypothetical protein Phab24_id159 [Acinetobacter phage Phab24]